MVKYRSADVLKSTGLSTPGSVKALIDSLKNHL